MFDALLLILVVLPVFSGMLLLFSGPPFRGTLGEMVSQGTAWLTLVLLLLVYGLSNKPVDPLADGAIAPFVTFAPSWLSIDLTSVSEQAIRDGSLPSGWTVSVFGWCF